MTLDEISTVAPDGWREITGAHEVRTKMTISVPVRVCDSGLLAVRDSGRLAVWGWHEIARSTWALLRSPTGCYYAGCRAGLTLAQARAHWGPPRTDERAMIYSAALALISRAPTRVGAKGEKP